jgi:hypothetical protein
MAFMFSSTTHPYKTLDIEFPILGSTPADTLGAPMGYNPGI